MLQSVYFYQPFSDNFNANIFQNSPTLNYLNLCGDDSSWLDEYFTNGNEFIEYKYNDCFFPDNSNIKQYNFSEVIRPDGINTNSEITIGTSLTSTETEKIFITPQDNIDIVANIYPDNEDFGKEAEIYVAVQDINKNLYAIDYDGNWRIWNGQLITLTSLKYIQALEEKEEIVIYSGSLKEGKYTIYIGYSLFTNFSKPALHANLNPFIVHVSSE